MSVKPIEKSSIHLLKYEYGNILIFTLLVFFICTYICIAEFIWYKKLPLFILTKLSRGHYKCSVIIFLNTGL